MNLDSGISLGDNMTDPGIQISCAITEMVLFFQEISLLLRTADGILENKRFSHLKGTTAVSDSSDSISLPQKWIPDTIYRCYKHPEDPQHIAAFISVILLERESKHWRKQPGHFSEPLITVGWAKFSQNITPEICSWMPKMYLWSQAKVNGKIGYIRSDFSDADKPAGRLLERCLAVPLVDIKSTENLEEKLLNPYFDKMWPPSKNN